MYHSRTTVHHQSIRQPPTFDLALTPCHIHAGGAYRGKSTNYDGFGPIVSGCGVPAHCYDLMMKVCLLCARRALLLSANPFADRYP